MLLAVIAVVLLLLPQAMPFEASSCDGSTYAPNSPFQASLNLVAAALPGNASSMPSGFATADAGTSPTRAYAMALCRGDVNASTCAACVAAAFRAAGAQDNCPNNTGATMYEDACVLRFSTVQFLDFLRADQWQPGELTFQIAPASSNVGSAQGAWFSAAATSILTAVVDHALAAAGNSTTAKKYFATGEVDFQPRIYALAQCLPEMTPSQCQSCLGTLLVQTTPMLSTKPRWIMALVAWCNLRYSVRPFYEGWSMLRLPAPPPPAVVPPSVTPESGGTGKKMSVAGISVGIVCSVLLLFVLSVFAFVRFKRRTTKHSEDDHPFKKIVGAQCMIFDLSALQEATESFSEKNKLGEGGFGIVYKGILADGQEIAVKKLLGGTGSGLHQLQNEVQLLAELQHKNLVRLQGFCSHRDDTLLVYEYIKNGSLDNFLFETSEENTLSWAQQHNIILGIAKGILYLHEDSSMRIIHRDLKPNNILVDDGMNPKIADFGLARLLGEGHTHTKTARAVGTLGYMAPEYAIHGRVSPKIDIFSFGVLVLEIVTGRRNSSSDDRDEVNLISNVWNCWTKGTISQMIDRSLDEHARSQALRCIHIGLMCVQSDPIDRPYISSVIFMLTRDNTEIQAPAQPAFFFGREAALASPAYDRSDFILGQDVSVNAVTITEPYPR
ncbi:putative receptor-like protein kinase At4g00960 isoform X2 [Triticum dicoccoides]|uniref:putative receptor-like protein kinase At4g00960 isoform X1 n=1 Tax=Triticum dicoccoides TaxID=85692 RepID=UPI00188DEC7B|nr:putative receptor-like protein kinase At4g00960 isoform X1 [Triticum dicoccoides]XP_037484667.1 putative receptor-like protein kinase At4g00960 isoform X2 [Triticum dicoccoides]